MKVEDDDDQKVADNMMDELEALIGQSRWASYFKHSFV